MKTPNALENTCLQFIAEKDFSYFCRYDDLSGNYPGISKELPAITESCYINKANVFLSPRK